MSNELIGVELIVAVTVWFLAVLVAFFFVGPVVGIVAILLGAALFVWWLVRVIGKSGPAPPGDDTTPSPG